MEFSKKLAAWILIIYAIFVFTCLGCIVFKESNIKTCQYLSQFAGILIGQNKLNCV